MNTQTKNNHAAGLSEHRVVTDLGVLLKSRHWAQRLTLFSRQAARSMMLGNSASRFRGRGMEFEEVRRYQPGDDIRTIDWKVSARAHGTYTKLFCEERERPCHIVLDQRSHLFFGSTTQFKSVLAAELATALAWAALAGGDRVGGQVIGDQLERDTRARRSKRAVLAFIHDIHELNHRLVSAEAINDLSTPSTNAVATPTSLANSLEECRRITRPGTAIFIVSDFHDFNDRAAKALIKLGKHADISLLQVSDPLEELLPVSGNVAISDGVHSRKVTVSKQVHLNYLHALAARNELLKTSATRARAMFTKVDTSVSARRSLINIFGR